MVEWSNQSRYNSFNSYKGLTYYEHYKQIVGWFGSYNEQIEKTVLEDGLCKNFP